MGLGVPRLIIRMVPPWPSAWGVIANLALVACCNSPPTPRSLLSSITRPPSSTTPASPPKTQSAEAAKPAKPAETSAASAAPEPAKPAPATPSTEPAKTATQATATHARAAFGNDPAAQARMAAVNPEGHLSGAAHDDHGAAGTGGHADLSADGKQKYDTSYMAKLPGPITAEPPKGYGADALTDAARTKEVNKDLDSQLAKQFPKGVSFKPPIKPADGPDAAKAKWGLLNASGSVNKSAEGDHVIRYGTDTRMMTTRTDASGKTQATLHAASGPEIPAGSKFTGANEAARMKAAKAAFKGMGITVKDSPKKFTADELEKVHAGLAKLSPEERKALDGTELVRTRYVTKKQGNHTVTDQSASAYYSSSVEKSGGKWVNSKKMQIADSAFEKDNTRFVGDGTKAGSSFPSSRVAVHEAGHGIEFNRNNDAWAARNNAIQAYNGKAKALAKGPQKTWDKTNKGLSAADKATAKPFNTAASNVDKAARALAKAKPTQLAARQQAYDAAVKDRDSALKALPAGHPAKADATALAAAQNGANKDLASTSAAQVKTASADGKTSRQLEKFGKFIKDNDVKPFTDYSTTSNAEFFAEATSLYKTDPAWMKANSPKLYSYFKNNEHLSDHADATAGKAIDGLAKAPRPISGADMGKAIVSATQDLDNHAASTEYDMLKKFATDNWSAMSPQAQKQFAIYEKYAKEYQAKGKPGIPRAVMQKMKAEVDAVK